MFTNYCDYEKAKTDWILACADEFKKDLRWEGLNLRAVFTRYLQINLSSVNKDWFKKKLSSKASCQEILSDLEQFQKSWKSKLIKIPGLQHTKYKIQWLNHNSKKITKRKPLIAVHHWKFVDYLKESKLFDELDPLWLVDSPRMAKEIGLDNDDLIIPHIKPFKPSKSRFPFNILHDLANGLKISLLRSRPSTIFVVEGDTPYHILLAEIGRMLDIPVYCFQWGIFHQNEMRINFSEMHFNKFLSWGPIFEEQLRFLNPKQDFVSFGNLSSNSLPRIGNKIIFLSQYVVNYITKTDQEIFVKLAIFLAKRFPNQVVWRPHPNVSQDDCKEFTDLKKGNVHLLDPKESLTSQLKNSVVAVGIGSSSLVDALHCGVIPISFNTTCLKEFPLPLVKLGVGFEFRGFDDALEQITDLMNNQDRILSIQNQIAANHSTFFSNTELSQKKKYIHRICKNNLI
ncbi:hypothetical protein N9682_06100 [Candidatus Pelagibacter sp.]|nr:hypothetical protein [Candidatus Pelagibacter sp.]